MKLVILGCGRVGARLGMLMEEDGHEVSVIDSDSASLERLPSSFRGQVILGTGIDVDVLKSAGIEKADAFAAVTNFDNTNIMACQVAKEIFGVKKVLARIYDPGREELYHRLGLETICPTTLISTAAHDILLTPQHPNTAPLRVDTTQDVVALAAALNDGNANYGKDHNHTPMPANNTVVLNPPIGQTPASTPAAAEAERPEPQEKDPRPTRERRGLFRH